MTRRTSARIAGIAFLVYIAAGISGMVLLSRSAGSDPTARMASIASHTGEVRAGVVLSLVGTLCAFVLGVTLYAITREVDPNLSPMILVFRTAEGVVGVLALQRPLARLWLATASGPAAPLPAARTALEAALWTLPSWSTPISALLFAVGSTVFAWLLVRGRLVPAWMAWLGVAASLLLVVGLPLQLVDLLADPIGRAMWAPMLAFELSVAGYFIARGVRGPQP